MIGDPALAAQTTVTALKRGAQSRTAVLAHARHLALVAAEHVPATAPETPASSNLIALARQLAATRPLIERSIVDLELRYGLDQSTFAKALGLSPEKAATRAAAVSRTWAATLDPAMMVALGPGSCDQLAGLLSELNVNAVLTQDHTPPHGTPMVATGTDDMAFGMTERPPATVGAVLGAAPEVLAHAVTCDICEPRLKRLTPVRTLMGQLPPETVPPLVSAAARGARRRLPAPLPPSIEPRSFDIYRLRTVAVAGLAVLAVGLFAFGVYNAATGNGESQDKRVERLINEGPRSSLLGTPSIITSTTGSASVANTGDARLSWNATSNASWLSVSPASGTIEPSQTVSLRITARPPANVVDDEAQITIVGDDGSRQLLRFRENG